MTPASVAKFMIKLNIYILIITLTANVALIYPFYLHMSQIANNIAMDVAAKNYVTKDELNSYLKHLTLQNDNIYASKVYRPNDAVYSRKTTTFNDAQMNTESITTGFALGGVRVYTPALKKPPGKAELFGDSAVYISVMTNKDSKSLLINDSSFDPMRNTNQMITGMDSGTGGGYLVQRGNSFKVNMTTRYVLTGMTFGLMVHMVMPVEVTSVGVTTQYYQYDK